MSASKRCRAFTDFFSETPAERELLERANLSVVEQQRTGQVAVDDLLATLKADCVRATQHAHVYFLREQ